MERINEKVFLITAGVLVGLELTSTFLHGLPLARELSPLIWTGMVRCLDLVLFFSLFRVLSVPFSVAGLKKPIKGLLTGLGVSVVLGSGFFLFLYSARVLWGVDLKAYVNPGVRVRGIIPLVVLSLIGPFVEEIFFRGLCYRLIRAHSGVLLSVILSAILFGMSHLLSAGTLAVVFVPLVGGIIFALLYEYTGSLYAPFVLHATANFILFSRII
jgi:membrane protease YdiL (CAAX protease family)